MIRILETDFREQLVLRSLAEWLAVWVVAKPLRALTWAFRSFHDAWLAFFSGAERFESLIWGAAS
jgi:hypothetical protein